MHNINVVVVGLAPCCSSKLGCLFANLGTKSEPFGKKVIRHKIYTSKRQITIAEVPHQNVLGKFIKTLHKAEVLFVIVGADINLIHPQHQSMLKDLLIIATSLAIKHIAVIMNKMELIDFSEETFEEKKQIIAELISSLCDLPTITVIPLSQTHEHQPLANIPWWKGPNIIEYLDAIPEPKREVGPGLRISIISKLRIQGIGMVAVGMVDSGTLQLSQQIQFTPCAGYSSTVRSLESFYQPIQEAQPGDFVGFNIQHNNAPVGSIVHSTFEKVEVAQSFLARITIFYHPTIIKVGYTPVVHCHTNQTNCEITNILFKTNKAGETIENVPLQSGDVAEVMLKPLAPMVVERFHEYPDLGRIIIRDMGRIIAAGTIIDVNTSVSLPGTGKLTKPAKRLV